MTNSHGEKPKAKRNGLMPFLALLPTIEAQIKAGARLSDIHAEHAEKLRIGYTQFTRYVNRYIRKKGVRSKGAAAASPMAPLSQPGARGEHHKERREGTQRTVDAPAHTPKSLGPRELPTFHYDPMDAYRYRNK